jgi:hypothetical protein
MPSRDEIIDPILFIIIDLGQWSFSANAVLFIRLRLGEAEAPNARPVARYGHRGPFALELFCIGAV